MRSVPLAFFSNGHRLDADLHLPDAETGAPYPVVIPASGYFAGTALPQRA